MFSMFYCIWNCQSLKVNEIGGELLCGCSSIFRLEVYNIYSFLALDRVDHVIPLNILLALGIYGDLLRWLKSYLLIVLRR